MARVYRDKRLWRGTGQVVWCIDFYDGDGRRRRERTDASTKEMAQKILRKRLDDIELGKIYDVAKVEPITFEAFSPEYLQHVQSVRSKSAHRKVRSFVKNLSKTFGKMILSRVTSGDVQRWVDARGQEKKKNGKPIKPATVVSEFVCLSAVFREAKKRGYTSQNPCRGVSLPRVNNKITRCLSEEQERKLLAGCSKELRAIVQTGILAGLRKEELLALRREDLDFETAILTVVHGKGEKMRHIPMVPELVELLESIPRHVSKGRPSPYVFNNPETGTRWVDISKPWAQALDLAGISNFRFHDLRHTFASRLVQRGVSLKAVQELLGHADLKMTMRYAHLAQGDLRDAVAVLSNGKPRKVGIRSKRPARVGTTEAHGKVVRRRRSG